MKGLSSKSYASDHNSMPPNSNGTKSTFVISTQGRFKPNLNLGGPSKIELIEKGIEDASKKY